MRYGGVVIAVVLMLLGAVPALAADDPPRWSLSTSFNYSTGDYGTGEDTDII
jgi:hypothetical protein